MLGPLDPSLVIELVGDLDQQQVLVLHSLYNILTVGFQGTLCKEGKDVTLDIFFPSFFY